MAGDKITWPGAVATPITPPSVRPLGLRSDAELNPAKWMYERLAKSIIQFEEQLNEEQEIGARLVNFSANETITIDDLGFWGPDLVKFYGKNANGHPVELMQHITQVNVLLVAVPKADAEPKRIGFLLQERLGGDTDTEE